MNMLKNPFFITIAVLILGAVLVLGGVPFQEAKAKKPSPGPGNILPSQIVTLNSFTSETTICPLGAGKVFKEFTPTVTNIAFNVPAGQVLVVTGAELFFGPQFIALGKHLLWSLVRDNGSSSASAFSSSVLTGPIGGSGSRSVTFSPGFIVPSGVTLCFFPPGVGNASVHVYGYLAPDV